MIPDIAFFKTYTYDGIRNYEITFQIDALSDVRGIYYDHPSSPIDLVFNTDFTIVAIGTVLYVSPSRDYGTGGALLIFRDTPNDQRNLFRTMPSARTFGVLLDQMVMASQQAAGYADRAIKTSLQESLNMELPPVSERAEHFLGFAADGTPTIFGGVAPYPCTPYMQGVLLSSNGEELAEALGLPDLIPFEDLEKFISLEYTYFSGIYGIGNYKVNRWNPAGDRSVSLGAGSPPNTLEACEILVYT